MNKLKKKVFWTIFGILTGALLIAVIVYNVSGYYTTQNILKQVYSATANPFITPRIGQGEYANYVVQTFFNNLFSSIVLFIVFTIFFGVITWFITSWIVKPAQESFNKQKDFIADASHELKTPLSVIIASSDALADNPKEIKWIKNIQTESIRMNSLITKLLTLSSSESINKENFVIGNLSKCCELAALTFEGKAIDKNVTIKLNIQPDIMFNYNDSDIRQLLEILLDNAIKHSKINSVVDLSLKKTNKIIELVVTNTGDPIPAGEEKKIFDRFYQVDKSRSDNKKGFGLGLSIAKNIAENYKANIYACSKDDITKFIVQFK